MYLKYWSCPYKLLWPTNWLMDRTKTIFLPKEGGNVKGKDTIMSFYLSRGRPKNWTITWKLPVYTSRIWYRFRCYNWCLSFNLYNFLEMIWRNKRIWINHEWEMNSQQLHQTISPSLLFTTVGIKLFWN